MKKIFRFFISKAESYLEPDFQFNHARQPLDLILHLTSVGSQNNKTAFSQKLLSMSSDLSQNGMGIMKALSISHLILMNTNELYAYIENILPLSLSKNINTSNRNNSLSSKSNYQTIQFLKDKALYAYQKFLLKCCSSKQLYSKIKLLTEQKISPSVYSFQLFFYIRNLFNLLIKSLESISTFARFFMDSHPKIIKMFADIGAKQAIIFYNAMVNIITGIIKYDNLFLKTQNDRQMIKTIIQQQFIQIDGDIKRILLNKYYHFISRGFHVRLFRIEEQQYLVMKRINQIINSKRLYQLNDMKLDIPSLKKNKSCLTLKLHCNTENSPRNKNQAYYNEIHHTEYQIDNVQQFKTAYSPETRKINASPIKIIKNKTPLFLKVFNMRTESEKNDLSQSVTTKGSQNETQYLQEV